MLRPPTSHFSEIRDDSCLIVTAPCSDTWCCWLIFQVDPPIMRSTANPPVRRNRTTRSTARSTKIEIKRKAETAERVETKVEEILGDTSPEAMAKGIVDNLRAVFVGLIPQLPEGERFTVDGATGYFTDIPFAMLNGVVAPRFSSTTVDHAIEAFIDHARAREVPMLWQLTPDSRPDNLRERLEAHGFHGASPSPGMAVKLGTLPPEVSVSGMSIELVRDPSALRLASDLLCRSFGMPAWLEETWVRLLSIAGLDEEAMIQTYLGRLDGEPVGVSSVGYAAGVAGVYNVGTLEAYRGKGIGRALTLAPLYDARERGYRVAVLHASEMGLPVYRRLGFKQYCEIQYYAWMNDTAVD